MKIAMRFCLAAFLVLTALGTGMARKGEQHGWRTFELDRMQINNVDNPVTNYGEFGMSDAHTAGCYWPKGSGQPYIFGAGIWIGAVIDGDTLVSCGYNTVGAGCDYCPGPPEHGADHALNKQSHPEDRMYFSTDEIDLDAWPVRDGEGNAISAVFLDPDEWAHQEVWCEYHDMVQAFHEWESGTYPIGIQVRQLAFAWNAPINENIIFFLYEFENIGQDTVKNMYVGHAADDDVGWADDDLLGCDIERSLGWTCTLTPEDGWLIGEPPYYVGKRFLQGPKADDTVYVSAGPATPGYPDVYRDTVYPGERLPLTSFTRCTRNYDADVEWKRYSMLAGSNIQTRQYDPWQGVTDLVPDDKRMVMGCGPFEMAPGEIDTVLFAVMFSSGDVGGLQYLKEQGDIALIMYENGWAFPSPPPPPRVSVIPGDQRVVVSWDNYPEITPDPFSLVMSGIGDTVYRAYDFEGYRLWKSRTALPGTWELLGEWDIENDIVMLPGQTYIPGQGIFPPGDESQDEGLWYSYTDEEVLNGISYYYAVTSFDYNTPGDPANPNQDVWVSLESGYWPKAVTPRSEPGNLEVARGTNLRMVRGGTNVLTLQPNVISSIAVTGNSYRMIWDKISLGIGELPRYSYKVYNETEDEWTLGTAVTVPTEITYDVSTGDSVEVWEADFVTPVFDGIQLEGEISIHTDSAHFHLPDSIRVTSGTYSGNLQIAEFFEPQGAELNHTTPEVKIWAYRGFGGIEIHWARTNDTLTARISYVVDPTNPVEIPVDLAVGDGWCFGPHLPFNPPKSYLAQSDLAGWFYISGVRYFFNGGARMSAAGFASIDSGDVWTIYSSAPLAVPCSGNEFVFDTERFQYAAKSDMELIRVVPNPYIVRADWDRSKDYRKIQFVNLPSECTIRIYNLAGDIVRTIEHAATSEGAAYQGNLGGTEEWDLLTRDNQLIASGIYIYYVSTDNGDERTGKFAIIR